MSSYEEIRERAQDALDDWYDEHRWDECDHPDGSRMADGTCWKCRMDAILAVVPLKVL